MTEPARPHTSRRRFLAGGALVGTAGATLGASTLLGTSSAGTWDTAGAARHVPARPGAGHDTHSGGLAGPTFRAGRTVDHKANGFNPTELLRDFDAGTTSRLPDGRTLREWEIFATDHEIEVAPGVRFPAWTFNARVPGPTLRATAGDMLRVRFVNGSAHPHTMHFHGIHTGAMDGVPGVGAGLIRPGRSTVYE
ncbi:MAG: multicopper oxidase domain-containing protein, partial [Pseudonocardiaceae bacterium]